MSSDGNDTAASDIKPYLVRAIHEWCTDHGYTPYLAVVVDGRTRVPPAYVKDGQIVLNVSFDATHQLMMENDFVTFSARFNGVAQELLVPMANVAAIYARENGQGMAFEVEDAPEEDVGSGLAAEGNSDPALHLHAVPATTQGSMVVEEPAAAVKAPTAGKHLTRVK